MMYIRLHNDGTGDERTGNYDVEVLINSILVWKGKVEGHCRTDGWRALVADLAEIVWDEDRVSEIETRY